MSKAMTETLKWMMDAAREIVKALSKEILCYGTADKTPATKAETTALRIISIHCPEDKRVGKIIETAKHMVEIAVEDSPDYWLDGIENLESALADYEEVKK